MSARGGESGESLGTVGTGRLSWERDKQNLGSYLRVWDFGETEKLTGHILAVGHVNPLHSVSGTIR